ncbi:acetate--CoA ligase family protein [Roseobacter ponti]|uniref:Acetate--CoA ligase family protein n=1 Tax=Roseobacter ponti TaxID=1891787 RepID=A0A858SW51_9RHOB|nr:acetate--CoA ligase family protein [Roseobacter ponti]QJF52925.1 acetate--CoA ligase family protein [Roseobacter ponti]
MSFYASGGDISEPEKRGGGDLARLLNPASVVVVGGGAWCRQVVHQLQIIGYSGKIWRVHPRADEVEGVAAVPVVSDLPGVPDAAFIGVNRHQTVEVVAALAAMGAGGAVCFASGFSEAQAEDAAAGDLQRRLVAAAGEMPVLGPNCYGFINALDGVLLWPDQHGCKPVARGVALLTQSSNIAINLTMQQRQIPVAFVVACGNMAQTTQAAIAMALLDDPKITAIGLHIEGFGETGAWHRLAVKAKARGVPLLALKAGASEQARVATVSHTASLAGSDAGADALLRYLGIPRLRDLPSFLEALKLLHMAGPLRSSALASISCSGGEAGLMADAVVGRSVMYRPLTADQKKELAAALGPMVALSNPLDYNTYIWGDATKMTAAWRPMATPDTGLLLIVLDYPHTDPGDWKSATQAAIAVAADGGCPVAVVSTLPELMPADVARELVAGGVIPLYGIPEAIAAAEAAAVLRAPEKAPSLPPGPERTAMTLTEAEAKVLLAGYGLRVPGYAGGLAAHEIADRAAGLCAPLVLKAEGMAHKSDSGGVVTGLSHAELAAAAGRMQAQHFLVEEMVTGAVAELLIGVVRDPAHGFILSVAAGGVMTELLNDRVSLMVPARREAVRDAIGTLRCAPVLRGYRGRPAADMEAILDAVMALQDCVIALSDRISEAEINPLMAMPGDAIAVDALVVMAPAAE